MGMLKLTGFGLAVRPDVPPEPPPIVTLTGTVSDPTVVFMKIDPV